MSDVICRLWLWWKLRRVQNPDDLLPHYRGMYRGGRWE